MNEAARKQNIADSLARAWQALAVADAALGIGSSADAVSRTYYASLHMVRALLFARGIDPRTHGGAQHQFNLHFVRTKLFPAKSNRMLAALQRQRELADYDPATVFDESDVREQIGDVRSFGAEVEKLLKAEQML